MNESALREVRLERLLLAWQDAYARGEDLPARDLCRDCPELEAALARRIADRKGNPSECATLSQLPTVPPTAGPTLPLPRAGGPPQLPGYQIERELGRGGMGVVYKATQLALKRPVALKMILSGHPGEEELVRFKAEAEVMAGLQHPNIVQVHEIGEHEGMPFFSLELIEGTSLDRRLNGSPQAPRPVALLVARLADALESVHAHKILHRDLKPANLLLQMPPEEVERRDWELSPDQVVKITDFGLARAENAPALTQTGAVMGTPSYMPPEQAAARGVDHRGDIYALGAILYECLTGRPPFKASTAYDTIVAVIKDDPAPPRLLNPKVPRDLETICLKCLHKSPDRRYQRAGDLAADLRRWVAGEPIHARSAGTAERLAKWAGRNPTLAALIAVCLLVVIGLAGLAAWHTQELERQLAGERGKVRDAERAEAERRRLASLGDDVRALLDQGKSALARRDWKAARDAFTAARQKAQPEEGLAPLSKEADEQMAVAAQAQRARDRVASFQAACARARAELTPRFTGQDHSSDLDSLRAALREALGKVGIDPEKPGAGAALPPERYLEPGEKELLTTDCYELLLVLSAAEARSGKPADRRRALRILDRAAGLGVTTRAYHLRRADLLAGDESARERRTAEAIVPATPVDHFLLGDAAYNRGDPAAAIPHYDAALRAGPDHYAARYFRAVCHLQLPGRSADERLANSRAAVSDLTICLRRTPDFFWGHLLRGLAHAELQEFPLAEEDFQRVFKGRLDDGPRYAALVNRGLMRLKAKNPDRAIADFEAAARLQPRHFHAHFNLAHAHHQAGHLPEALASLERAVRLAPERPDLYRLRAILHGKKNDEARTLADLTRAIALEKDPAARAGDRLEKARRLRAAKKPADALAECRLAVRESPRLTPAYLLAGEVSLELRESAEAEEFLDLAAKLAVPGARLYRARGLARAMQQKHQEALDDYTRALALSPEATTFVNRGWAHVALDAPRQALRDFDAALRLRSGQPSALVGRGLVRITLGERNRGEADLVNALKAADRDPVILYQAARGYCQLSTQTTLDGRPGARTSPLQRAGELLAEVMDRLPADQRAPFWQQTVAKDTALTPLRTVAVYQTLNRTFDR